MLINTVTYLIRVTSSIVDRNSLSVIDQLSLTYTFLLGYVYVLSLLLKQVQSTRRTESPHRKLVTPTGSLSEKKELVETKDLSVYR